jgi:hypothetical protein
MKIRNLSSEETKKLRLRLEQRLLLTVEKWQPYWYPLCTVNENVPVIAFDSDFMAKDENLEKIRTIFVQHNISSTIELHEFGNARIISILTDEEYFLEEDEYGVILPYMSECFWFDSNKDWVMYASHEATVAFGGEWLVNAIKRQFENYTKYEIKRFIPTHERNYD